MSEASSTAAAASSGNPLLQPWQTPFETPPFDAIRPEHFLPAFDKAFADHTAEIEAIKANPAEPTFENTVTALERAGKLLNKVGAVFYDLVGAHSNPELLKIESEVALKQARHWNPISMDAVLFDRVSKLRAKAASLKLTLEEKRLLERTWIGFHRAGAGLSEAAKTRTAEINERLAHLATSFSHHLLGDEQDWTLELGEDDLAGLPESFVAGARAAAEERGQPGKMVVTLSRSYVEPFLKDSSRRDLREKVYKAFTARGDNGNANDNNAIILEVLKLREERAKINKMEDIAKRAVKYGSVVTPLIEEVGTLCARLEQLVDNELWPLPKFQEMLFTR